MKKFLCLSFILLTSCSNIKDIFPDRKTTTAESVTPEVTAALVTTKIQEESSAAETLTKKVTEKTTTTSGTTTKFPTFSVAKSTTTTAATTQPTTTSATTTKLTTTSATTTKQTTTERTTTSTTKKTTTTTEEIVVTDPPSGDFATEVVRLVNIERQKVGRSALSIDYTLASAAETRAYEIMEVFSHTRPDNSSCFTIFDEFGINYGYAGENIAAGQHSPQEVVTAWMNSPGHKKNILDANFKHIGIGYINDTSAPYKDYWVQLFTD
jgi:uncharacterized protein YkwD